MRDTFPWPKDHDREAWRRPGRVLMAAGRGIRPTGEQVDFRDPILRGSWGRDGERSVRDHGRCEGNCVNYRDSERQSLIDLADIEASMPGGHGRVADLT
jgi:hypothetical protein